MNVVSLSSAACSILSSSSHPHIMSGDRNPTDFGLYWLGNIIISSTVLNIVQS